MSVGRVSIVDDSASDARFQVEAGDVMLAQCCSASALELQSSAAINAAAGSDCCIAAPSLASAIDELSGMLTCMLCGLLPTNACLH